MIMLSLPISEASQVADARRKVSQRARDLSLSEKLTDKVAIVVTELATNLVKFAQQGTILVSGYDDEGEEGIQILSLDKGPGIENVSRCLEDGYSSAGSAGAGLGAIRRMSRDFAIGSWRSGTVIMTRIGTGKNTDRMPLWAALEVPLRGEEACGDAICARRHDDGWSIFVADGLGHGPLAAEASFEAIRRFRSSEHEPAASILQRVHDGLRATRGAAAAVCQLNEATAKIVFAGIGNISATIVSPGERHHMISLPGTLGHIVRKFSAFDYPFPAGSLLVMHSDGLSGSWTFDEYPGLLGAHPMIVAGVLLRDYARARDDASVIVARSAL